MSTIRVAGIDPSLANTGLSKFDIDLTTFALTPIGVLRLKTENEAKKGMKIRKNSDDLRRAHELYVGIVSWLEDCELVFAEIPSGAQSARAALAFGIVAGFMGAVKARWPIIQVMPNETKTLGVGIKNAAKEDVMEWAFAAFPDLGWETVKRNGVFVKTDNNEHAADACAIVKAGILTDEFKRTAAMLASMRRSPALASP